MYLTLKVCVQYTLQNSVHTIICFCRTCVYKLKKVWTNLTCLKWFSNHVFISVQKTHIDITFSAHDMFLVSFSPGTHKIERLESQTSKGWDVHFIPPENLCLFSTPPFFQFKTGLYCVIWTIFPKIYLFFIYPFLTV